MYHTHTDTDTHTHTYIHIDTHVHTHIHIQTHTNMRREVKCLFLVVLVLVCVSMTVGADRFKRKDMSESRAKPKPPNLNTDLVPSLEEILEELSLNHRKQELYKMGVVDTRILLRLKKMDFHMMTMEWSDAEQSEIDALKNAVEKYVEQATVTSEEVEERDLSQRNKLTFGRLSNTCLRLLARCLQ